MGVRGPHSPAGGARPGEKSLLRRGSASRAAGGRAPAPEASNMLLNLGMGLGGRMHLDSLNFGRAHGTPISTSPSSAPRFPGGSVAGASGAAPSWRARAPPLLAAPPSGGSVSRDDKVRSTSRTISS